MSDSIRQQICDDFHARLETILVSNGYATNLGLTVEEWRTKPFSVEQMPAVTWRDVSNTSRYENKTHDPTEGLRSNSLTIVVEIVVADGSNSPKFVRQCVADVYKAIGVDPYWSLKASRSTHIKEDRMTFTGKEETIGGAIIEIEIDFDTDGFDLTT